MKINYIWMEISGDGLLKLPEDVGPYYSSENVNPEYGAYDSEEEAIEALNDFWKRHEYECNNVILVKTYNKC